MSDLYMRVCSMNIGGRVVEYPPMTLEFETEFSSAIGSSQTKAKIYNPAPETISACEKKGSTYPKITIDAGYQADHGTCVIGEIVKYEVKPGVDRVLELSIGDKSSLWLNAMINRTWRGSITASNAARQILADLGITALKIDLENDITYDNLCLCGMTLQGAMARIARDSKSSFFFKNGQALFLKQKATTGTAFYLSSSSGLLEYGKITAGYKIKSLFNYRLWAGSLVTLKTKSGEVNLKASKGKHSFSTQSSAFTEFEAVKL